MKSLECLILVKKLHLFMCLKVQGGLLLDVFSYIMYKYLFRVNTGILLATL